MSNPYLVQVPFCVNGNKNTIQKIRQPTQDPEDATYEDGFPPETMIPTASGGLPPKGLDFNGIFYELSSPIAHYCRGDRIQFDAAYASAIGGYANGAILASNDYQKDYISLVDNNTADPNGSNTTWAVYAGQGSVPTATSTTTGTVKLVNSLGSTATDAALTAAMGKNLNDIFARFAGSLTTNGGCTIALGNTGLNLIVKWGRTDNLTIGSSRVITFPQAFPNACLNVNLTSYVLDFDQIIENMITLTALPTRFQFTVRNMWVGDAEGGSRSANAYWFAIGY